MPLVVRALRVVVTMVLVVAGMTVFGAPRISAHAQTQAMVTVAPTVTSITSSEPLSLTIDVSNPGNEALSEGFVAVYVSSTVINKVSALENWISATDNSVRPGRFLAEVPVPEVPAGGTVTVTADVSPQVLRFSSTWGPRGLAASYLIEGNVQATARSAVVITSGVAPEPIGFSAVVALAVPPTGAGLLTESELNDFTQPAGILTRQLDFVTGRPVLVGIDPMILASIDALGDAASESVVAWRNRLNQLPNPTFLLAYADADISLQAQAGQGTLLTPSLADLAAGDADAQTDFVPSLASMGWPQANTVSSEDISVFSASGITQAIYSAGNLSTADNRPSLVSSQGIPAIVTNEGLSSALVLPNPGLASAFLAAAALDSSTAGKIYSAMPRQDFSLSELKTAATHIDQLLELAWVNAASVSFDSPTDVALVELGHSPEDVQQASRILESNNQLALFASIAEDPDALTGPSSRNASSVLSVGWADEQEQALAARAYLSSHAETVSSIEIVTGSTINMVGGQVNIPIAVRNSLSQAVTVVVTAQSSNARLTVNGEQTVTVQADSQKTAQIPVQANASNGQTVLRVQMVSPTGVVIGEPQNVVVEVRAEWEAWALGILIVCFAGLVIVGTVRTIRKNRTLKEVNERTV